MTENLSGKINSTLHKAADYINNNLNITLDKDDILSKAADLLNQKNNTGTAPLTDPAPTNEELPLSFIGNSQSMDIDKLQQIKDWKGKNYHLMLILFLSTLQGKRKENLVAFLFYEDCKMCFLT